MKLIYCENCGKELKVKSWFLELNQEIRDAGWEIRMIDNEWCNFCCLECYEEYKENFK